MKPILHNTSIKRMDEIWGKEWRAAFPDWKPHPSKGDRVIVLMTGPQSAWTCRKKPRRSMAVRVKVFTPKERLEIARMKLSRVPILVSSEVLALRVAACKNCSSARLSKAGEPIGCLAKDCGCSYTEAIHNEQRVGLKGVFKEVFPPYHYDKWPKLQFKEGSQGTPGLLPPVSPTG